MIEEFYSERRAAVMAGVSRTTLRRARRNKEIRPFVLAHAVFYPLSEIQAFKARHLSRRGRRENAGE
jgi:hypothetical protein